MYYFWVVAIVYQLRLSKESRTCNLVHASSFSYQLSVAISDEMFESHPLDL